MWTCRVPSVSISESLVFEIAQISMSVVNTISNFSLVRAAGVQRPFVNVTQPHPLSLGELPHREKRYYFATYSNDTQLEQTWSRDKEKMERTGKSAKPSAKAGLPSSLTRQDPILSHSSCNYLSKLTAPTYLTCFLVLHLYETFVAVATLIAISTTAPFRQKYPDGMRTRGYRSINASIDRALFHGSRMNLGSEIVVIFVCT